MMGVKWSTLAADGHGHGCGWGVGVCVGVEAGVGVVGVGVGVGVGQERAALGWTGGDMDGRDLMSGRVWFNVGVYV